MQTMARRFTEGTGRRMQKWVRRGWRGSQRFLRLTLLAWISFTLVLPPAFAHPWSPPTPPPGPPPEGCCDGGGGGCNGNNGPGSGGPGPGNPGPLHVAVSSGRDELAQLLIDNDSNVNAVDKTGATPLHVSVHSRSIAVARLLLRKGARIDIKDKQGETPLDSALNLYGWSRDRKMSPPFDRMVELLRRHKK